MLDHYNRYGSQDPPNKQVLNTDIYRPRHSSPLQQVHQPHIEAESPCVPNQSSPHRDLSLSSYHRAYQSTLQQKHDHNHNHNHNHDPNPDYEPPQLYPPRTSSLPGRHNRNSPSPTSPHLMSTISSTTSTASATHTHIPIPIPIPQHTSTSTNPPPLTPHSPSPLTSLTIPQFQHNLYPLLNLIASQMYRASLWREATRVGGGNVLRVQAPTIGQTARRAEQIGWNLGWEGWRWT